MLSNLLAILPGDGSDYAGQTQSANNFYFDNFGEAALYALIGFVVVFVGIILIIAVIWLVGLLMRKTDNLAFLTKKRDKKAKAPAETSVSAQEQVVTSENDGEIPTEVKVAIVAAITAYYEEREEKCEFTVKRIKRL